MTSSLLAGLFVAFAFWSAPATAQASTRTEFALENIASELATLELIRRGDLDGARRNIDVDINRLLTVLRLEAATKRDDEPNCTEYRLLSAVRRYWGANPPFKSKDYLVNSDSPWFKEWMDQYELNIQFMNERTSAQVSEWCAKRDK